MGYHARVHACVRQHRDHSATIKQQGTQNDWYSTQIFEKPESYRLSQITHLEIRTGGVAFLSDTQKKLPLPPAENRGVILPFSNYCCGQKGQAFVGGRTNGFRK